MWEAFKDAIFWCIQSLYTFVADWGLAIIVATLIFRLVLSPIMQKQIKSSYQMQKFSPRIQEIQRKYEGDQQRIAAETQKITLTPASIPSPAACQCFCRCLSSSRFSRCYKKWVPALALSITTVSIISSPAWFPPLLPSSTRGTSWAACLTSCC